MEEVTYAYHVTNVVVEDDFPPNWKYLEPSEAPDEDFDGPLYKLDVSGVFLTTTQRKNKLPKRTVYPIIGTSRESYWRVSVPMTRFNNKRIIKVQENDNNNADQVLLLLADNSYSNLIDDILWRFPEVEELTEDDENEYLTRDEVTKDWYSNNFDPDYPYWVNIFVPHRVRLGRDCVWDAVQHY